MEFKNKEALNAYLKKTRYVSYLMLAVLAASVVVTAVLFYQLKAKDLELSEVNAQLKEQKEEYKESRQELMVQNRQLKERVKTFSDKSGKDYLMDSLREVIYDAINSTSASVESGDISQLSAEELRAKISEVNDVIVTYDAGRRSIVEKIFTAGEAGRKEARVKLQKEYSLDTKLIPDILEESKDKVNLENKNAYYQIIYLLGQLDDPYLKKNGIGLKSFFDQGKEAGLHGSSTQADVDRLRRKIE